MNEFHEKSNESRYINLTSTKIMSNNERFLRQKLACLSGTIIFALPFLAMNDCMNGRS